MIFKTFQNNFGSLSGIYPLPGICYVLFLPSIIGVSLSGERPHSLHFRQDCQHNGGYKYFLTKKYFRQIKILLPTLWKLWSPSLTESSGNAFISIRNYHHHHHHYHHHAFISHMGHLLSFFCLSSFSSLFLSSSSFLLMSSGVTMPP